MMKFVQLTTPLLIRKVLTVTVLAILSLTCVQLQAQQNPYPFNLDLSLGGGLIGNPDVNTSFQPEVGFSYMPGKFGIGLNAGLLSYAPSFDAQQYATGFEEYTSVSGSDEKWSSLFLGIGPRFEFGGRLPVTFRSSLDLSLSYNSPPSVSVDFNDPDGSAGDLQLQLSGYEAGDDYSKWSAAIRPEFQMQFSPGGSDRFAITVATGIQHRLSQNEFTYSQRDLSEVRLVPNSQEMFMQFEMAPEVQQTANPPQTNFFTTVGIKIKFGKVKHLHDEGVIHRDIASRASSNGVESGDCDDSDADRCLSPGEIEPNDADSDGDGLDDGTESKLENSGSGAGDCDDSDCTVRPEADVTGEIILGEDRDMVMPISCPDNDGSCPHPDELLYKAKELELASAGNDIQNIKGVLDRCGEEVCEQVRLNADNRHEGVRRALENPSAMDSEIERIRSIVMEDVESLGKCETDVCREVLTMEEQLLMKMNRLSDIAKVAPAQDYNAARSNKPTSRVDDIGDSDADSDGDGIYDGTERVNDGSGAGDCDDGDTRCTPDNENIAKAVSMAKLIHPQNVIIAGGAVAMKGSPLYEGNTGKGENPLYEGQMNDGNEDGDNNSDPLPSQRYDIQPSSYCMEVATMRISTNSQKAMRGSSNGNRASSATDYNSSRSNTTSSIDMSGGDGNGDFNADSTRISNATDYNSSRSNTTSSVANPNNGGGGDLDNDSTGVSMATSHNASRSNRSQGISDQGGDTDIDADSSIVGAQNHNSSRSNRTSAVRSEVGENDFETDSDSTRIASATDYNSSRSNTTSSIADLGGDLDGDGFPDLMEDASLTMTKRKRPGRAKYGNITLDRSMNDGGDLDGDGLDDASGLNIELEMGDPDSDDDGLMDAIESATYSISKRSARTGRSSQDSSQQEMTSPNNVYKWTYKLNALSGGEDLPGNGTLSVVFTGGSWHFDLEVDPVDPDDDGDGFGELLKNSSFSISKRSARTGRNR